MFVYSRYRLHEKRHLKHIVETKKLVLSEKKDLYIRAECHCTDPLFILSEETV